MTPRKSALLVSLLVVSAVAASAAVSDFGVSSSPGPMTVFGSYAYFAANTPATGTELWRTDGTRIELVKDIAPGTASGIYAGISPRLVELNGALYFLGSEGGTNGSLWKTDGTAAGTVKVLDLPVRPSRGPEVANGRLFIVLGRGSNVYEIWTSDGTAAGTQMLQSASDANSFATDGLFFFIGGTGTARSVWRSDGTSSGTFPLPIGELNNRAVNGGTVYIADRSGLVRTDGTVAGTMTVKSGDVRGITVAGGTTYFWLSPSPHFPELWKTDGTPAGTVLLKSFDQAQSLGLYGGGSQLFIGAGYQGIRPGELWRSDGTEGGTTLVKTMAPLVSDPFTVASVAAIASGNVLYFAPFEYAYGREVWRSDGTPEGTFLVADIDPRLQAGSVSSEPSFALVWNGAVYFSATNVHGRELWRTDGTAAGTRMVANLTPEGTIRVHAFDRRTNAPVTGTVNLASQTSGGFGLGDFPLDADGRAVIEGLRPNSYFLQVFDAGLYLRQNYDRRDCPCTQSQRTAIPIDSGQTVDANFPLTLGGRISGHVVDAATGSPRSQHTIRIQDRLVAPTFIQSATTDEEGNYQTASGVPPGSYVVFTSTLGYSMQVWRGIECPAGCGSATTPVPVAVAEGATVTGIDFAVKTNGFVRGTVRDAMTREPIGSGRVSATLITSTFNGGSGIEPVFVRSDGTFEIQLPDGVRTLFWEPSGSGFPAYRMTQFPSYTCANCNVHGGTPVTAVPGETTGGYDIVVEPLGARLRGIVRDAVNDAPVRNASVTLYRDAVRLTELTTNSDGRWSTPPFLTPGTYTLVISSSSHIPELHGGEHCPSGCDPRRGAPIVVNDRSILDFSVVLERRPGVFFNPPRRRATRR